jgi:hypothetical protein
MSATRRKSTPAGEPFLRFSPREKEHFLAVFIEDMTIAVRDAYLLQPEGTAAKLKSWNELLHRVSGNLRALIEDSSECFPDDALFEMIHAAARDEGLHQQVEWALRHAYEYLERNRSAKTPRKVAPAH